jgi:hypothetical protein
VPPEFSGFDVKVAESVIADPARSSGERLEALSAIAEAMGLGLQRGPGRQLPARSGESNNHIHTCYSFSPYTPAGAALAARRAGLDVAGSVDHDSYAAAGEMRAACAMLDLGVVTGFELRVSLKAAAREFPEATTHLLTERKLNNPDSTGIIYMTIQGVPVPARAEVEAFLEPVRNARYARTKRMVERANSLLSSLGLQAIDFKSDIVEKSKFAEGGTITERHLLAAVSRSMLSAIQPGPSLVDWLEAKLGLVLSASQRRLLSDPENPFIMYDLLGALKAGFLDRIFIQPDEECVDVRDAIALARHIGAIAAYAYLGDVAESPTGDKKAEKFEDEVLDELLPALKELGFSAITYMPPRNTKGQLLRLQKLCAQYDFMEISGVDINQPRQSFRCPELLEPEFRHLDDATWAMVAHEALCSIDERFAFFADDNPFARLPIKERISLYSKAGREIDFADPFSLERITNALLKEKLI